MECSQCLRSPNRSRMKTSGVSSLRTGDERVAILAAMPLPAFDDGLGLRNKRCGEFHPQEILYENVTLWRAYPKPVVF
jgi:hypothetical protein